MLLHSRTPLLGIGVNLWTSSLSGAGRAPAWVSPGAAVDLDFAHNRYWAAPKLVSLASLITASGGANGTVVNAAGNIVAASAPRFNYSATSIGTPLGLLVEEARTNLFLNSAVPVTQTITVANASAYSISFYGSGTFTLSGALTQVMTGSGTAGVRTTFTGTTTTTSLVVTVTGSTTYGQVELGAFPLSEIITAASSGTRSADVAQATGALLAALQAGAVTTAVKTNGIGNPAANFPAIMSSSASGIIYVNGGATSIGNNVGSASATASGPSILTVPSTEVAAYSATSKMLALNGTAGAPATGTSFTPGANVFLGSANGTGQFIDGQIARLAVFAGVQSAAQIAALSQPGAF